MSSARLLLTPPPSALTQQSGAHLLEITAHLRTGHKKVYPIEHKLIYS